MRAVVEIERDLGRKPSLRALASRACLSPFHFHRVFRAIVGESPGEYGRRLRIERAAQELYGTRRAIAAIGREAGYSRPESFTRAFTAHFGVTPGAFRESATSAVPGTTKPHPRGRIERLEPVRVAFMRHIGPYHQVTPVFDRIAEWVARRAARPVVDPLYIGVAHDNPSVTAASLLRFDCCVAVGDDVQPQGEIGVRHVLGGTYAGAVHAGPFDAIHEAYAWLAREFIPSQKASLRASAAVEMYITPPGRTPPAEQLTEVLLPVSASD